MSRKYKFKDPNGTYFVSFAVVEWIDVFSKDLYKDVFIDVLTYYQKEQGLEIFAYVIMTNHVHLLFRSLMKPPEIILGKIKSISSRKLIASIENNKDEERKEFFLMQFEKSGKNTSNVKHRQFWRHDNMPKIVFSPYVTQQKINYIHQNPVKDGSVDRAEDFSYSSALDYAGGRGKLGGVIVLR